MNHITRELFLAYWSGSELVANTIIALHLLGALLLGLLVGYERSYHGRAAGMRTYGLVCMASAALTVVTGLPESWFGGLPEVTGAADPTRVIQGIVTGIGFLGAGVIMKEGFNISGLTTAASIWASAAIGILVGLGLYLAGILFALFCVAAMMWGSRLENWLPSHPAIAVELRFKTDFTPTESSIGELVAKHGFEIAADTLKISALHGVPEWQFVAIARNSDHKATLPEISAAFANFWGVESYQVSHARN